MASLRICVFFTSLPSAPNAAPAQPRVCGGASPSRHERLSCIATRISWNAVNVERQLDFERMLPLASVWRFAGGYRLALIFRTCVWAFCVPQLEHGLDHCGLPLRVDFAG